MLSYLSMLKIQYLNIIFIKFRNFTSIPTSNKPLMLSAYPLASNPEEKGASEVEHCKRYNVTYLSFERLFIYLSFDNYSESECYL